MGADRTLINLFTSTGSTFLGNLETKGEVGSIEVPMIYHVEFRGERKPFGLFPRYNGGAWTPYNFRLADGAPLKWLTGDKDMRFRDRWGVVTMTFMEKQAERFMTSAMVLAAKSDARSMKLHHEYTTQAKQIMRDVEDHIDTVTKEFELGRSYNWGGLRWTADQRNFISRHLAITENPTLA